MIYSDNRKDYTAMFNSKDFKYILGFYQKMFYDIDKMIKEKNSQLSITAMLVNDHGLTMWESVELILAYTED